MKPSSLTLGICVLAAMMGIHMDTFLEQYTFAMLSAIFAMLTYEFHGVKIK